MFLITVNSVDIIEAFQKEALFAIFFISSFNQESVEIIVFFQLLKIEVIDQISSRKTIAKLDFCFKQLMVFPVFETVKVHDWLHL
jgi:hypothetical protein